MMKNGRSFLFKEENTYEKEWQDDINNVYFLSQDPEVVLPFDPCVGLAEKPRRELEPLVPQLPWPSPSISGLHS